ncbi:hypothetical protein DYB32_004613, partial [Aphanomyces invadans]
RKGIPPAHRASVYLYLCCESVITPTFVEASYGAAMAQVFHSGVPIALTHHTTYFGGCVELAPFDLTPPQVESFHRLCILFKNLSGINYCDLTKEGVCRAWWAVLHALVNGPSFDFDAMFAAAYRRWYGYLFKKANIEAMHKLLEKQTSVHVETANHAHHNDGHYHMPLLIAPRSRSGRLLDPCRDTVVPTWLPPALQMKHLSLVYTAEVDGRGLERLYTHCEAAESPEMLLLVEELATSSIIGVFVSQPLQIQPTFFGDHRCFPFVLAPTPHVFKQPTSPTHHDTTTPPAATVLKYMLCLPTMMSFGVCASSSAAALELDEDLMRGKSDESDLFQSPPLVGTTTAEFDVGGVEVYAFSLD